MGKRDLVMTIDDQDEDLHDVIEASSDEDIQDIKKNNQNNIKKQKKQKMTDLELNKDFEFSMIEGDLGIGGFRSRKSGFKSVWNFDSIKSSMKKPKARVSLDEMISNRLDIQKAQNADKLPQKEQEQEQGHDEDDSYYDGGNDEFNDGDETDPDFAKEDSDHDSDTVMKVPHMSDIEKEEGEEEEEFEKEMVMSGDELQDEVKDKVLERKKQEYFENADIKHDQDQQLVPLPTFSQMNLSRPILRALNDLQFTKPTKIQTLTVPVALAGKDICGAASTGSGKTAAFLLPILERLLYRPKGHAITRVLVLTPTRELAAQCHSVAVQLAKYTDISFCLCVGGASNKEQEMELRKRPDVVIATPGRLIDHLRNSAAFGLETLEILVMDEADRMLEEGFEAELSEIINSCPHKRQTLLFSATMTDDIDQLVRLSLKRPVRLFLDPTKSVADKLTQEFIRVRLNTSSNTGGGKDEKEKFEDMERRQREAITLSLCQRTYKSRVIIFCPSKIQCHRMKIIFGLNRMKAVELHGSLSQLQRLEALEQFRDGKADFLLATDLASRGLDIVGVETVINFQMPGQYDRYVHRVGRTARHLASGKAVSLVGDKERKMVKMILKNLKTGQVAKQRVIPAKIVQKYKAQLDRCEDMVGQVLNDEKEERAMQKAEMTLEKAENMAKHGTQIFSRPPRTWFQSEQEKKMSNIKFENLPNESSNVSSSEIYEEEMEKELAKIKRGPHSGLSRKEKRMKEMKKELGDLGKVDKMQKMAARHAKKEARQGIKPVKKSTKGMKPKRK